MTTPEQGVSAASSWWTLLHEQSFGEHYHLPPKHMGCWGRAEIRWLQNREETFIFYCIPCQVQKVTDCTWTHRPIKLSKQKLQLVVMIQGVHEDAGEDVSSAWICSLASSVKWFWVSSWNCMKASVYLCIGASEGEANYLSSLGRPYRQDLLVLILIY